MKRHLGVAAALASALGVAAPTAALAHDGGGGEQLRPGNLLVSGSTYREADIQPGVTQLPPGCSVANCVTATSDGAYPYVFNNDVADASFGVTSPIFLWQLTPGGDVVGKIKVPTDQLVTSFSSKSEIALNLSTTGRAVTFMGYVARPRELDVSTGPTWQLAYTLQSGLNLGQPYVVPGYPIGDNAATKLPWAPATDGLRNLTGRVNRDGSVTLWAVTSTVSGSGDQGADPNQLMAINDNPSATTLPAGESFHPVMAPRYGRVVRGVSLTPGGSDDHHAYKVRTRRDRVHARVRVRARRSAR